jgi:hypothetical protein
MDMDADTKKEMDKQGKTVNGESNAAAVHAEEASLPPVGETVPPAAEVVKDFTSATHLELNDGMSFLRFARFSALAAAQVAEMQKLEMAFDLAEQRAQGFKEKANSIIGPIRLKYGIDETGQIDEQFRIVTRSAKR